MPLNELRNMPGSRPEVSDRTRQFAMNFKGGPIPDDIRAEMEKFIEERRKFADSDMTEMLAHFDRIFNK